MLNGWQSVNIDSSVCDPSTDLGYHVQGSVLGPLLLSLYTDDPFFNSLKYYFYADDIQTYCHINHG